MSKYDWLCQFLVDQPPQDVLLTHVSCEYFYRSLSYHTIDCVTWQKDRDVYNFKVDINMCIST
jgi:hypothetical protein